MMTHFLGGPLAGVRRDIEPDYEFREHLLTYTHRIIVAPPPLVGILESQLDQAVAISYRVEYHTYKLVKMAIGLPVVREPYPILMDDEVVWGYEPNPYYQYWWEGHYADHQLQAGDPARAYP